MRGDAMIAAWIIEGDVLYVRKTANRAEANGKLIVCRLDDALTVKRATDEDAERYAQIGIVVAVARELV